MALRSAVGVLVVEPVTAPEGAAEALRDESAPGPTAPGALVEDVVVLWVEEEVGDVVVTASWALTGNCDPSTRSETLPARKGGTFDRVIRSVADTLSKANAQPNQRQLSQRTTTNEKPTTVLCKSDSSLGLLPLGGINLFPGCKRG